jgi:phospholipid/cholesterol/gamma-HCH transport system permease protein
MTLIIKSYIPGARALRSYFEEAGNFTRFILLFFRKVIRPRYEFNEVLRQCYLIGYKTFPLVGITGFIVGLVMTIQSRPTLLEFGAVSWLPAMVAVSIIREIGPVIMALVFAGKAGSGIGAELASMKVTEQIDAMEVSGMDPFKYLVVTRVLATTIMLPLLIIFSDGISLAGSFAGVNIKGNVSLPLFITQVFDSLSFSDIFPSITKTFFFGFTVGLVACYKGYYATAGTEGVGKAANASVVIGSLAIFIIDMAAVQITDLFY